MNIFILVGLASLLFGGYQELTKKKKGTGAAPANGEAKVEAKPITGVNPVGNVNTPEN